MPYIKELKIEGFKRFENLHLKFNSRRNIIVGENEKGKSTILEAISILINQRNRNLDKYIIMEMLNTNQVNKFYANPSLELLPEIYMELEIHFEEDNARTLYYYGAANRESKETYGISFKCSINDEFIDELTQEINSGRIPYEYYEMSWKTFAGKTYNPQRRAFNSIIIDNTNSNANNSFNYYNKSLFYSKYDSSDRLKVKDNFRTNISSLFQELDLEELQDGRRFGVNHKRVIFENIISIYDEDIPLENKGKGMENIIKTKIALDKNQNKLDCILIEEPENHLSHSNLIRIIDEIDKQSEGSQLIITTHSNMIASRLNLKNVIWISENDNVTKLDDIEETTAKFFIRADDNKFLQFLLSEKVILVEGATEYLLIPKFFQQETGETLIDNNISVISCNGLTYKRYLEIAKKIDKRVAVITDNDGKEENIDIAKENNDSNELQKIFMDDDLNNFTWEKCIYDLNKETLDKNITVNQVSVYLFNKLDYGQVLGKMLNNKVDVAYEMLLSEETYKVPEYVKEAMEWIR